MKQIFSVQTGCHVKNLTGFLLADLSKNKLPELPAEVTRFSSLEKLVLYHNVIRFIPDTVMYLQNLTYLDIRWVNPIVFLLAALTQFSFQSKPTERFTHKSLQAASASPTREPQPIGQSS